jgi:hypothetical protein
LEVHAGVNGKGFPAYEQFIEDSKGVKIMTVAYSAPAKEGIFNLFTSPDAAYGGNWIKIGIDKDGNFNGKLSVYEQVKSTGPWYKNLFQRTTYKWNLYTIEQWNKKQTS